MAAAMRHWKPQFHHSPSLPLETVLKHWIKVQIQYTHRMDDEDYSWSHGERATIGFLAAAAWLHIHQPGATMHNDCALFCATQI